MIRNKMLEPLFREWRKRPHHNPEDFIDDGIIDELEWSQTDRRVLLLLKEAYDNGFDLCQVIRQEWQGPKLRLWWNCAYWCYLAQSVRAGSVPPFPEGEFAIEASRKALLSSAVVNLKKSHGQSRSSADVIGSFAREDSDLIRKEVALINPHIMICGGTWQFAREIWPDARQNSDKVWQIGSCVVVDSQHPGYWACPDRKAYDDLAAILAEARLGA